MREVKLGDIILNAATPQICVPLTGRTEAELVHQAAQILTTATQLVEWRLDYFQAFTAQAQVLATAKRLREMLGNLPIIATFRSKSQGGEQVLQSEYYFAIYQALIKSQLVAGVDIELPQVQDSQYVELLRHAHAAKICVIVSDHHFEDTPTVSAMMSILKQMVAAGADLPKLAVMPKQRIDVLKLMTASVQANNELQVPLITMAMGQLGRFSRVLGGLTGSVVTFGQLTGASAPGQLPIQQLKAALDALAEPAEVVK